jgi:hypothetical protein
MPNWDDPRGPRHDPERERWERDRWRRDPLRDRTGPGGERRAFGERYPSRYPQPDQPAYGRAEDAGAAGYARHRSDMDQGGSSLSHGGEPYAYGGQEYGVEGYAGAVRRGPAWGVDHDAERLRNFDFDDPGVGQSQAGYAAETRSHAEHGFDPDYLRWREEQLRAHDRDYEAWRRDQHRQYDEQYRQFRLERQRHFGEAFHEWRSQRSAVGGVADTGVAPGVSGYGPKTARPGYSAYDKPSGYLDPPGHLSTDPALSQRGGSSGPLHQGSGGDHTPEFGKEPGPVQAASDGDIRRQEDTAEERAKDGDARKH